MVFDKHTHTNKHIHNVMRGALAGMEGRQSHCNYRAARDGRWMALSETHKHTMNFVKRKSAREAASRE